MRNPQMGNSPIDVTRPRPPEDENVVVIDEDTPMDSATAYQANPVNQAMRKARVVHEKKMEETPNFKSLGELKTIFSSNLIVQIYVEELDEEVSFKIRKANPTDLLLHQRSLLVLTQQIFGEDNKLFDGDTPPSDDELLENLSPTQVEELMQLTVKSQQSKFELILNNTLEPELDIELLNSMSTDVIDVLYNAIAGHIQGGQEFLTTFRGDGEQPE